MTEREAEQELILFNRPGLVGTELDYVREVFADGRFSGNREFTQRCNQWFRQRFDCPGAVVTGSGTHALEMTALLSDVQPGDEVILASYGFSSTANAYALRGAKLVFVDIRPDTMNLDEERVAEAITDRTRAIAVMHYAGVACEMDRLMALAREHDLLVFEDAAHAILSTYKGRLCGTFGAASCFSFHETKNIQCGEGGALLLNDPSFVERSEILQEKGTDRARFFRGQVDKYTWVDIGSSFILGEINAAFLWAQLEAIEAINADRMRTWELYREALQPLAGAGHVELPNVPEDCVHNAHCFYVKTRDLEERTRLAAFLKERQILAVFHYIPLHSAPAGEKYGRFHGEDRYTTRESERLLRLPLYYGIGESNAGRVAEAVLAFYERA